MGYKGGLGPVVFEALESPKRRRIKHREDNEVFKVEDYPIAGKEDKDLRYFANQGFIVAQIMTEKRTSIEICSELENDAYDPLLLVAYDFETCFKGLL